jgi:hypothetical protein
MTDCKVCYYRYDDARSHCPVCGTLAMTDVVIESVIELQSYLENRKLILSKTVDGKIIHAAHGCERTGQYLYPRVPKQVE